MDRDTARQPNSEPIDEMVLSEPLEDEEGGSAVVGQENTGRQNMEGGGEWPDPNAPPQAPAPGAVD